MLGLKLFVWGFDRTKKIFFFFTIHITKKLKSSKPGSEILSHLSRGKKSAIVRTQFNKAIPWSLMNNVSFILEKASSFLALP